ncbi:sensor histidine kinase [Actinoplanes sp. CA-051413]|uniref:sensor histidine kinase n=1 Tax=Actinoplanes sp. CA-051413 TaxID=3239899 RepID=UPI003D96F7F3
MHVIAHLRRVAQARPHVADAAIAALVWVAALLTTAGPHHLRGFTPLLLATVACVVLVVRRRWPYPVLLVSTVAAELFLAHQPGTGDTLILAAPLVALYTVAESSDRRRSLLVGGLLVLALGAFHTVGAPARWLGPENVALAALGGLAVAAGEASRNRRAYLAEVLLRAEDAERDREAETRRRLTEERLRIARDLHDSVGHHLALINVQAGVARHVLTDQPAPVRETFDQIRQGSRAALDELRDTVGLLRRPEEVSAPVEPTVGLAALDDLLSSFTRSGLQIVCDRHGDTTHLSWAADVTAYRVVQESLTNICKHAGPVEVRLSLRREREMLTVIVDNDGPPATGPVVTGPAVTGHAVTGPAVTGPAADVHGIIGMRERVAALGGTLLAGPRATGGGFRVTAVLPAGHPA